MRATPEEIAKSLEGNWREELLFVLRQHVEFYRIYQKKITDCDLQLRKHLKSLGSKVNLQTQPIGQRPKGKRNSKNAPDSTYVRSYIALRESTGPRSMASMS